MPSFKPGTSQNIVYQSAFSDATDNTVTLKRYDVQKKATKAITSGAIKTAQISHDGQWLLLSVIENATSKMMLMRMDGQDQQTLYCAPKGQVIDPLNSTGVQWSPDQKHIVFTQGASFDATQGANPALSIFQLDLSSGKVQLELAPIGNDEYFNLDTWVDATHVSLLQTQNTGPVQNTLYLLDTGKGPISHISDLQLVRKLGEGQNFALSADGKTLFEGSTNFSASMLQSVVDAYSTSTGKVQQLLTKRGIYLAGMRVINSSSLVFVSGAQNAPTQDIADNLGWWKINTDGSGLTHINKDNFGSGAGPGTWGPFSPYSKNSWSNFSRDSLFYIEKSSYGSINGGPLTSYTNDNDARPIGWTTM